MESVELPSVKFCVCDKFKMATSNMAVSTSQIDVIWLRLSCNGTVSIHSSSSSNTSWIILLCGLSHSSSSTYIGPSPCLPEDQRSVVQTVEQLQCVIFKRLSGAAYISGMNRLSCRFHHSPSSWQPYPLMFPHHLVVYPR